MYFLNGVVTGFVLGFTMGLCAPPPEDSEDAKDRLYIRTGWCIGVPLGAIALVAAFVTFASLMRP